MSCLILLHYNCVTPNCKKNDRYSGRIMQPMSAWDLTRKLIILGRIYRIQNIQYVWGWAKDSFLSWEFIQGVHVFNPPMGIRLKFWRRPRTWMVKAPLQPMSAGDFASVSLWISMNYDQVMSTCSSRPWQNTVGVGALLSSIFQNIDIFFSGANNLVLTTPRQNDPNDGKLAYAFTPQQYTLAEDITGTVRDRSLFTGGPGGWGV